MELKKRTNQRSSVDGFVRRNPSSLNSKRASRTKTEGFTGRPQATKQIAFSDEAWSDDQNTLTLGIENLPQSDAEKQKLHFWQFKKRRQQKQDKNSKKPHRARRVGLVVLVLLLIAGGFLGWKFLATSSKVFNGNVLGFLNTTKLKGEDQGRVNMLLAGTSEDDGPDHGGAALTDSIILASINTRDNTAFTTSIPRDLWVKYGEQCSAGYAGKINNTYECGESVKFNEPGYPKGGMGLLMKVVSTNFGIPIQYYGKIDYTAFKDSVNAVGGIQIKIESSDPRGIYDPNIQPKDGGPVRLKNGTVTLDGVHALALARSRNAKGGYGMSRGDFDRTLYQRKMLIALKDKALSAGVLSNPAKISSLLDAAGDNVKTNFNTSELRRLHDLSKLVKTSDIKSVDLASTDLELIQTGMYSGQSIVMPTAGVGNFAAIKSYFKKLTSNDPVVVEGSTVVILNGSSTTGLAQKYSDIFSEKGLTVLETSNASIDRSSSVVVDLTNGSKPKTKQYLLQRLGLSATTNKSSVSESSKYTADFVVILGKTSGQSGQ